MSSLTHTHTQSLQLPSLSCSSGDAPPQSEAAAEVQIWTPADPARSSASASCSSLWLPAGERENLIANTPANRSTEWIHAFSSVKTPACVNVPPLLLAIMVSWQPTLTISWRRAGLFLTTNLWSETDRNYTLLVQTSEKLFTLSVSTSTGFWVQSLLKCSLLMGL